jgi:hypothetical protein
MRVLSTSAPSKKGNGRREITLTNARSLLRFEVGALYVVAAQKKICKDMITTCPAAAPASSRAHNASAGDASDTAPHDPARDAKPIGTPHCKTACSMIRAEA